MKTFACSLLLLSCMFMYTSEMEQQTDETEYVSQSWMRYLFCCGCMHDHVRNVQLRQEQEDALLKKYDELLKKFDPKTE